MRLWAAQNDSDQNFFLEREDLVTIASEQKQLRGLLKVLLGNLHDYDVAQFDYNKLTVIDKYMLLKYKRFGVQI